ncbi:MAG: PIN domain-containing protein [Deltaproteobacteria bacterium]|nr:PIN domain-containing protein [Deltaproteobacteria bacterium]
MKKYVIDTNALISFVTDRNPEQQVIVKSVLESVSRLKGVVLCHTNVLTEFVYVLERVYKVPPKEIKDMIKDFKTLPGIKIIQEIDFKAVFEYWPEVFGDFGDALVASLAKTQKGSILLTFDQKFLVQIKKAGLPAYF